jgi:hypothetical protein
MNGRERVLAALNHNPSDRGPIVLGASNATSMQKSAYRSLKNASRLEPDRSLAL